MEGLHIDFQRLAEWMKLQTVENFDNLITRFTKFSNQADQVIGVLKSGVKKGMTNHKISMVKAYAPNFPGLILLWQVSNSRMVLRRL